MQTFYPLIVPISPLLAALVILIFSRLGLKSYKTSWWIIFSGFLTSLLLLFQAIQTPEPKLIVLFSTPWDFLSEVVLSIDRLTAVMMVVISGFCTLVYRYSIRYLQQDAGHSRFLILLALKVSTLLFMVSSSDLVTLYIAWQLLSWFLTLLFHNYAHIPTVQSSFRTFIILRGGNLAFLTGIVLAYHLYGTVKFTELFERAAASEVMVSLFGTGFEIAGVTAVTLFIFLGIISKSAQFPLHIWLPESMYSPTPVSAMLHAGSINVAGFLLHRLAPLYTLTPFVMHFVLVIGLITAIAGTCMMLVQNDIKKTLAYSTIGQMGYMVMECGVGAFSLAVFHLISHGLFKADLFLCCGKGIHEARLDPSEPQGSSTKSSYNMLGWASAFVLSFLLPLFIIIGVHNLLGISLLHSQGLFILFLFSWVTASQAMITLFRLRKPFVMKGGMLVAISLVSIAYFFAAEQFMHFLVPDPAVVEAYFHAAELPPKVFLMLVALLVILIASGWFFLVSLQQNKERKTLFEGMKSTAYLLFVNRLYIDGITLRFLGVMKRFGKVLNRSPIVVILLTVIAVFLSKTEGLSSVPPKTIALLLLSGLLVPLFPFHIIYVAALSKAPRALTTLLSVLLPVLGVLSVSFFLHDIPLNLLPLISALAICGAFWGSIKALLQSNVSSRLSYGGLALYSIFWINYSEVGKITSHALLYLFALTLVWSGLVFAWDRVRVRYGNLNLSQISGLFQPMPRFALCMALLVMAAVGLPPFGLFFGYLGILFSTPTDISFDLVVVIITWFIACWHLFKLMQQLLFGPYRKDIHYDDLRPAEITTFVFVISLLLISSGISQNWLSSVITEIALNVEGTTCIQ